MKKSSILTIIALVLVLMLSFTACGNRNQTTPDHECESACGVCGLCLDAECTEEICANKCQGHDHTHNFVEGKCECGETDPNYTTPETTPVISVNPTELEINAGDEIDLMFGVSVTDEGDEAPRLLIEDDDDFDAETEGVYTITYKAINKYGKEATATRTITVNKALSDLTLEVKENKLGETKWQGNLINFKNQLYVEISADATYAAQSGVFHNTSTSAITLNVGGGYGVSAIIDANGVVIEGRDGANGRLVNEANPVRSSSTATTIQIGDETVSVVDNFAQNMVIPAGGYAIVIQNGYAGTTVDNDGRGFMNWNVIYQIGNVVRLYWADTNEALTTYVDQAPTVTGNNSLIAAWGDTTFDVNTAILEGIVAKDDNGTFESSDDVQVNVTVVNDGGFDINTVGKYTITLSATDGTHTTTFTREVEVVDNSVKLTLGGLELIVANSKWLYNQEVTANTAPRYSVIAYDKNYTGTFATNGYGAALVLDQYGRLVKIYDGANLGFYTAEGKAASAHFTTGDYAAVAWSELQNGELLLIFPNDGGSNTPRTWALKHRDLTSVGNPQTGSMGQVATITGFTFGEAPHECENKCAKCGGCLNADCENDVCATKCPGHAHECESACETCGKCTDTACTETVCAEKCACHECESVCEHCGKCTDGECTQAACTEKCQGHEGHMFVTIGTSKKYEAVEGMWAINETITTATAANKAVWVFTKDYTGDFSTNGYGVAVVLDVYGRIIRVYDGANAGYTDAASGVNNKDHGVTADNYATLAWSGLQDGEILVVFPNGADGNKARQIGLDARWLIGQKMNVTGVEYASMTMTIQIGSKNYTAELGKWAINETITTSTAASKAIWIFTKDYTGDFSTNGYGAAVILDKFGRVVRIYDGANAGYTDAASGVNNKDHGVTADNYATLAWQSLQDGETLVLLPNGGSDGNAARQVGLDCRWLIGQKMSVTGITFASTEMTIQIGTKTYTAELGKWAVNETITTSTAANKAIWVFTKDYTGEFSTNGYGVAVVLTAEGKVARIYDGANAGYTDAASGVNNKDHGVTADNYATLAWQSLQDGEILVLLPNGGSDGNTARQVGLDCRWLIGQKMSVTGFEFK